VVEALSSWQSLGSVLSMCRAGYCGNCLGAIDR
jgi:hypothetical protein